MPKMKSNRAASKRFRLTGSGKVRRSKAYGSHILTKKTPKRKRSLRKNGLMHESNARRIKLIIAK
ncbi:MAG TPA: 50S ribosomal protein L35 [bacterium]|nr:50S ribosomal protein L35 [bacterium]HPN42309.1 50S ribosomal protein L35 [bacterium]